MQPLSLRCGHWCLYAQVMSAMFASIGTLLSWRQRKRNAKGSAITTASSGLRLWLVRLVQLQYFCDISIFLASLYTFQMQCYAPVACRQR